MVKLITGRSGSGKTEQIHELLKNNDGYTKTILIVPEQSSYLNEKKLLSALGAKRAAGTEVLSFKRLCSNILDKYGAEDSMRIDDSGRAVLMSRAITSVSDRTELLTASGRKKNTLIAPMLTAVNEYKMCMISPEMLSEAAVGIKDIRLASKLRDSALIYSAYDALLEGAYSDPDDDLTRLCRLLCEHNEFEDMCVCFDGFSGFSATEMQVVECILEGARDVYFSICTDTGAANDENGIFAEPSRTLRTLRKAAQAAGHNVLVSDRTQEGLRFKSDSLRAVEEGVFSLFRGGEEIRTSENDGAVTIYEADDIYDEVRNAAAEICRLVENEGYEYSDIEIITPDPALYRNAIDCEFPKYNITYFMSSAESIETKPLIRFLLSGFEAVLSGYDTDAVLRFAATGLTPLDDDEIFALENYVFVWSIKGRRWLRPFTMAPDGSITEKEMNEQAKKAVEAVEEARKKLISPLESFEKTLRAAENGAEITEALYSLTEQCHADSSFRRYISALRKSEGAAAAQREAAVWDSMTDLLSKMHELMKDDRSPASDYFGLLRLYVRKCTLSEIPRTVNSVTIGKTDSVRSGDPRAVFILGAVNGSFPAVPAAVGLFTDSERRFLRDERSEDERLPLYDSIYGAALKEKYSAYMALTAPSEKLFVSYFTRSSSGTPAEPSPVISEICSIINGLEIRRSPLLTGKEQGADEMLFSRRQGFDICAEKWNDSTELSQGLENYYGSSPEYSDRINALRRASDKQPFRLCDTELARKLYGVPLRLSSTRLSKFSDCRFAHFCKYGLGAYPLKKADMDAGMFGTAAHYIFETILRGNGEDGIISGVDELVDADDARIASSVRKCMDNYVQSLGSDEERGERFAAMCSKVCTNAVRVLVRMREQYRLDQFRPVDFELAIGGSEEDIPALTLALPTGETLTLSGYVDRVDAARIEGKDYIRIIDYKTSDMKFSFRNLAGGINIQMLLYLSAILRNGSKRYTDGSVLLPAGVLYVPAAAGGQVADSSGEEEIKKAVEEQNNALKMNGLLLDDEKVLSAMNSRLDGSFIPQVMTSKGTLDKRYGCVVTGEEFEKIFKYVDICLLHMAEEVYMGSIEAFPMSSACKFCDYSAVCRFEKGSRTNKLQKLDKEKALKKINEELSKAEAKDGENNGK